MTSSERFSKKTIDIVFEVTICELAGQEARAMLNYFDWIDNNSLTIRVTKVPDGTLLGPNCLYCLLFQRCDLDGDGKLDYQEFKAMILRSKHRKEEIKRKKGRNPPNLGEEANNFKER